MGRESIEIEVYGLLHAIIGSDPDSDILLDDFEQNNWFSEEVDKDLFKRYRAVALGNPPGEQAVVDAICVTPMSRHRVFRTLVVAYTLRRISAKILVHQLGRMFPANDLAGTERHFVEAAYHILHDFEDGVSDSFEDIADQFAHTHLDSHIS